nr:2-hydroxyacid dehydrogenase [uncultured Rhodopila sp.]
MRIAFHGDNAASFTAGFAALLDPGAEISILPNEIQTASDHDAFVTADVIIGNRFSASLPRPSRLRLLQLPSAGYDAIDFAAVPQGAVVCNCFGHENAIAEYVMAALLQQCVPLADADRRLRRGEWAYWAGAPERTHREIGGSTLGLLGFGHIGKEVARRAKAFGMSVYVANRSPVAPSERVDRYFPLATLPAFWSSADSFVITIPLTPDTAGIVGVEAFAAMRSHAVLINVARGPVVDEHALYDALHDNRIGGAVIDTWYQYPTESRPNIAPSARPFDTLSNILMTPHMSGWTDGTIRRRQAAMAENIRRRMHGEVCENIIHGA